MYFIGLVGQCCIEPGSTFFRMSSLKTFTTLIKGCVTWASKYVLREAARQWHTGVRSVPLVFSFFFFFLKYLSSKRVIKSHDVTLLVNVSFVLGLYITTCDVSKKGDGATVKTVGVNKQIRQLIPYIRALNLFQLISYQKLLKNKNKK